MDQIALASATGARTYTVGSSDAASTTAIAIQHALAYRVPTVLSIPYDVGVLDVGSVPEPPALRHSHLAAPAGGYASWVVDEIADALTAAERPLLLAGRGAWLADAGNRSVPWLMSRAR